VGGGQFTGLDRQTKSNTRAVSKKPFAIIILILFAAKQERRNINKLFILFGEPLLFELAQTTLLHSTQANAIAIADVFLMSVIISLR
jgi:hypothetical protein